MRDELGDILAARTLAERASERVAVVTSTSPLEVQFQGQTVAAVNGIPNLPLTVGDAVRVVRSGQQLVILGNASAYPTMGVVSAYAAGTANCSVVAGDDTFDAQTVGTWTPVVGDRVVLWWMGNPAGNAYCFAAKRGAAVASPGNPPTAPDLMNATSGADLPTPPPPVTGPQTVTLLAQQTGCYYLETAQSFIGDQGRYWLYSGYRGGEASGDPINAYWFYGDQTSKIRGATVTKIEMWVQRMTGVGPSGTSPFHLVLHQSKTKPATDNTFWDETREDYFTLKPGQSAWVTLPLGWGTKIAAGTALGVGIVTIYGTDVYKALIGIDHPDSAKRNAQSGALRVTYTRS